MKVLVYGGKGCGAREHILALAAQRSSMVDQLYCPCPNGGIAGLAKYRQTDVDPADFGAVVRFAQQKAIDLVLVGPEAPLVAGLADQLLQAGIPAFGPTAQAAMIEGSKLQAKKWMAECGVPTADYVAFTQEQLAQAVDYVRDVRRKLVIKADGLAAGKGVTIVDDAETAEDAVRACLERRVFGAAGDTILAEEFLEGYPGLRRPELSVLAFVDVFGNFVMMRAAQDFKPIFAGDKGPNTGGTGSLSPIPWVTDAMMQIVGERIFKPMIELMKSLGIPFSGVLYAGLIWTKDGPKVIEWNCRFGDPEIVPLFMALNTDLLPIMQTIATGGSIANLSLSYKSGVALTLVLMSNGYPGDYAKGFTIKGLDQMPLSRRDFMMAHAGTVLKQGPIFQTAGGRVLDPTVLGPDYESCAKRLQEIAQKIIWGDGGENRPYWRPDIGFDVQLSLPELP